MGWGVGLPRTCSAAGPRVPLSLSCLVMSPGDIVFTVVPR